MFRQYLLLLFAFLAVIWQAPAQPTYSNEVSRIIQAKCQMCHRPNDIAPFALMNYEDASTWAEDIAGAVSEGRMPPWKPVAGHGEFRGSYALTEDEKITILSWVHADAPEGDPSDLPEPTTPTGEWQLGDPDIVLQMAEPFTPPRGRDLYRCFVISNPFDEPVYVSAVDLLPGDRKIVHHAILFLDETGQAAKLDEAEEGPGYTCFGGPGFSLSISGTLGGWAPGTQPRYLPDGIAMQIPKGGSVVLQVHYHPLGQTGEDVTRVGLYLSKTPVERRLFFFPVVNTWFEIPPGESDYEVRASLVVPPFLSGKIIQIFPHMHLLGKEIRLEYKERGEEPKPLIYINQWDFNWQGAYTYKEPIPFGPLTNLTLSCRFDNSEGNPRNPNNPLKPVRWGEGTEDEMCIGFVGITLDQENLLKAIGLLARKP